MTRKGIRVAGQTFAEFVGGSRIVAAERFVVVVVVVVVAAAAAAAAAAAVNSENWERETHRQPRRLLRLLPLLFVFSFDFRGFVPFENPSFSRTFFFFFGKEKIKINEREIDKGTLTFGVPAVLGSISLFGVDEFEETGGAIEICCGCSSSCCKLVGDVCI